MDASSKNVFAMSFNQDLSCFSIGTRNEGYKLYNLDPFGKIHSTSQGGYGIVEMLFCTSLVALVGLGDQPQLSPRRLQIVNTKRQSTICELTFPTSILSVKLNRKRLVVILELQIYVYDISNMKLIHTIETTPNPMAICALSTASEQCFLAFPSAGHLKNPDKILSHAPNSSGLPSSSGNLVLFDLLALRPSSIIEAHKSPLAAMSLHSDGTLIATASDKGTIVRVFAVPQAQKLFQFRRGTMPAKIHSMTFNLDATFLAVSSDSDTVHVFKLACDQANLQRAEEINQGSSRRKRTTMGMIRKQSQSLGRSFAGTFGSYLPNSVTEIWEPMRDFASLKITGGGTKSIAALSSASPTIMVITDQGEYIKYAIDLDRGGECELLERHALFAIAE